MQQASRLIKKGLIFAGTIAVGLGISSLPAQALSFAGSIGFLRLSNFSPGLQDNVGSSTFTDTFTSVGSGSSADAIAEALATISALPVSESEQGSLAAAFGQGTNFEGEAVSASLTNGSVGSTKSLRFDFMAVLGLIAGSDLENLGEFGRARGAVGFVINDGSNPLDFFNLFGQVSSNGENSLRFDLSDDRYFSLQPALFLQGNSGLTQYGLAVIRGSYQREFETASSLTIQGATANEAIAAVPSPALVPGALVSMGMAAFKRRRQTKAELSQTELPEAQPAFQRSDVAPQAGSRS